MKRLLLKLIVSAVVPAVVLAGCAPSSGLDSPDPADPTTQPPPASPEPTETSEAPTPADTPTASESPGASDEEDGDIDEQDGVRTNAFNAMPSQLADMRLVSSESDPSEHRAQRDYMAEDEQSRLLFMAYIPHAEGGGYEPVFSNTDRGFQVSVDSGKQFFETEGLDVIERSTSLGGYEWECFEALEAQNDTIDHSFCLTTAYGRVIELQRLAVHNDDEQARNGHMDGLLEAVAAALDDIGA